MATGSVEKTVIAPPRIDKAMRTLSLNLFIRRPLLPPCPLPPHACDPETVWRTAQKHSIPAVSFVNKLDREGADFQHVLTTLERRLGVTPLPLQVNRPLARPARKSVLIFSDFWQNKIAWRSLGGYH